MLLFLNDVLLGAAYWRGAGDRRRCAWRPLSADARRDGGQETMTIRSFEAMLAPCAFTARTRT
jgi:hypothetical protein